MANEAIDQLGIADAHRLKHLRIHADVGAARPHIDFVYDEFALLAPGRSASDRFDWFAKPSMDGGSLRSAVIQSGTERLILTTTVLWKFCSNIWEGLARPERLELPTLGLKTKKLHPVELRARCGLAIA